MKYPIQIIERHHIGPVREWTLYDRDHLIEVTNHARTWSSYTGELDDLDAYLDWLGSDLYSLTTTEAEE